MFGIGGGELLMIALVAVLVFGPQRIPELARRAAQAYRELLRLRRQVDSTLDDVKRDLSIHDVLNEDHPTGSPPLLRPPDGQRQASGPGNRPLLPVPDEDDYLGNGGATAKSTAADLHPREAGET